MFILKFRNCRVFVTPLIAVIETAIIFYFLHAVPSIDSLGMNFIDCMIISSLILIGMPGSLFMHEYAHSLAARWIKLPVKEIHVSFIGAFTSVDNEPSTPKGTFVISIAGPLMNIFIGIILYAGHLAFRGSDIISTVCFGLSVFNGMIAAYNLLPVMPLDGGFIVRSVCWSASNNFVRANQLSFNIGTGFTLFCFLTGIINILIFSPVMGIIFFIAGLSLGQNAKSAYQRTVASRLFGTLIPKSR